MQRPALYNGIVVLIKKNCSLFINDAKIMINTFGQTIARSFFLLCIHSSEINLFKRSTRGDKKFTKFQNEISARDCFERQTQFTAEMQGSNAIKVSQ